MPKNLSEMLEISARKYRWRKVIFSENKVLRYGAFYKKVNKIAKILQSEFNIKTNDKIAVLLENSEIYPIIYFAILKLGAVVVPLNTFLKGEELKYILNNSNSKFLITSSSFFPVIDKIRPDLSKVENIVLTDSNVNTFNYIPLEFLLKRKVKKDCLPGISPSNSAVIIYTSGTTGFPKGAILTHKNLVSNVESCILVSNITSRDRALLILPMFHSFTMTVCMLMPIAVGAGIVITSSLHHFKKIFKRILLRRVSILVGIPSIYTLLAKADIPWLVKKLLNIRLCICGAAPLPEATLTDFEKKWKVPLLEGYGLSEASPVVSLNPINGVRKPNSVGLPIDGVEVRIVDTEEGELGTGKVGEIIIKGKNVMTGYYKNPQATVNTIRNNWLFTGDMGKIDKDGYLYIVDRKKDMIMVRGLNIYPREVEHVIREYPGIAEVSVVGKPDEMKGEVPIAFVILKEGIDLNKHDLIKYCRDKLADYKVPRQINVRDRLPHTPTGKILKRELKKMVEKEAAFS